MLDPGPSWLHSLDYRRFKGSLVPHLQSQLNAKPVHPKWAVASAGNGPEMGKNRQNARSGPQRGMISPKIAFFLLKTGFLTQKEGIFRLPGIR